MGQLLHRLRGLGLRQLPLALVPPPLAAASAQPGPNTATALATTALASTLAAATLASTCATIPATGPATKPAATLATAFATANTAVAMATESLRRVKR